MSNIWIVIVLGLVLYVSILFYKSRKWKSDLFELNSQRPELNRDQYIEILIKKGFKKKHIEVVYDEIRNFLSMDDFSMYPNDDIHKLYRIDDLDDIELIDLICKKLNLRQANQQDFDEINKKFEMTNAVYILTLTKYLEEKTEYNNLV